MTGLTKNARNALHAGLLLLARELESGRPLPPGIRTAYSPQGEAGLSLEQLDILAENVHADD